MAKGWYVIHTYSGHENKVKTAIEKKVENLELQEKIFQIKVPTIEVPEIKDGKKKIINRKFFPGYVLIEMELDDSTWLAVKNTPGVTNFVGGFGGGKPKPLTEKEVNGLFDRMGDQTSHEKAVASEIEYTVGEHIRVIDGPFGNFTGVVEEVYPEKGRLRVKVEIFGRGTPVELDFLQVGKI